MLDLSRLHEAVRSEGGVSRRLFLAFGSALAAVPLLGVRASAADRKVTFDADPFSLGVASGDPAADSVVLWTKLAPKPLEADGGMKPEVVNVGWEIAEDDAFKKVVASGTAVATPQLGHTVHIEAAGLKPDRWYHYRFRAGDATSPVGRTRTMPAADATPDKLKLTFASCQHYEQGFYTAYEQMAKDTPDLVFHLGDYIYEYPYREPNPNLRQGGATQAVVRRHTGPKDGKLKTLADYRGRHALYRADKFLHQMHALCPWFVTWDDHEVDNNYANDIQEEQRGGKEKTPPAEFLIQRAAAYQAYYEFMPLRKRSLPTGPDMLLYRKASFGRLAEFFVLDTRQYRTDQPNGDGMKELNEAALDPKNTQLGKEQRKWLDAGLIASEGQWNILAQQVMMGMVHRTVDQKEVFSMDQWPGYAHERNAVMKFLHDRKVPNPVVLTGDIHSNWVNDLRTNDLDEKAPVVAAEFVGTSISTGGNGKEVPKAEMDKLTASNPGVRFYNRERGYVRCTITPTTWTSDYVVVDDVRKEEGKCQVRASFVVEAGTPGAKKV